MSNTPRGAPELAPSQALPETTVNEQTRRTEAGASHFPVADRVTAPPGSCLDGAVYLIVATATGAFTGLESQLAVAAGTNAANGWYYRVLGPKDEGVTAWVQDEDAEYRWSGTAWGSVSSGYTDEQAQDAVAAMITEGSGIDVSYNDAGNALTLTVDPSEIEATSAEIWAGTSQAKVITPKALHDATAPTALTSGTTITPDFNAGLNFSLTLGHNATLANPSNAQIGDSGVIVITQDGTGSRTMAYGSNWKFPAGAPTLSTAAGTIDCLVYYVSASGVILCNLTKAYSS